MTTRFIENNIPVKAIAASNAQNDSGIFELNFRDERYLPFEGAGAISEWSLELFNDLPANNPDPAHPDFGKPLRQFDYRLDFRRHAARQIHGERRRWARSRTAQSRIFGTTSARTGQRRLCACSTCGRTFLSQWHRFLHPTAPTNGNIFELEMSPTLFPVRDLGKTLKINTIWLLARCADAGSYGVVLTPPLPEPPPAGSNTVTLTPSNQFGGLHFGQKPEDPAESALGIEIEPAGTPITWRLRMTRPGGGNLQEDPVTHAIEVEDILLILGYEWE